MTTCCGALRGAPGALQSASTPTTSHPGLRTAAVKALASAGGHVQPEKARPPAPTIEARLRPPAPTIEGRLAVWAVSDLHVDHPANLAWVQHLAEAMRAHGDTGPAERGTTTCCIVCGDVSDDLRLLQATFDALHAAFDVLAFVPGNHCLWVKADASRNGGAADSVAKLRAVMQLCDECGVLRHPAQLGGLLLVPLLSWHHKSFDREPDIPGTPRANALTIADYSACRWPEDALPGGSELGSEATAAWLDAANEQQPGWSMLQRALAGSSEERQLNVISFSHFLPHQHLLPEKRMLTFPNLSKAVGSDFLWRRLQQLRPQMHMFGHSHFAWDATIDGIRFLQAPLCYPSERQRRLRSIVLHTAEEHAALQQQQQQPGSSNGSGGATTRPQQAGRVPAGQHRHRGHGHHEQGATCCDAPWLPVHVYDASFSAQLMQGAAACHGEQHWLAVDGIPVLHRSQLPSFEEQQQKQPPATAAQHAGSSSSSCYVLTSWAATWCEPLHGLWSDHYSSTARQPGNTELAPWVAKRYRRYRVSAEQRAAAAAASTAAGEQ